MNETEHDAVLVSELLGEELAELRLEPIAGENRLDKTITNPRVQKPGLAFAGYTEYIKAGRVQIVGESEIEFMETLPQEVRDRHLNAMTDKQIPVFVVTKGLRPPDEMMRLCEERQIPVLASPALSSTVIKRISFFLEDHLVPTTSVHGVLMEIYGLGVLLIGESGVGKSECALDLISRGHSLVADDRVRIKLYPSGGMIGFCEPDQRHHMELRGIGIVDIQDLFGLAAVRERKSIDLVVELEPWDESKAYDRLGLDESVYEILGSPVPYIRMPVALGRNLSILVEIAARNHVLKLQGHDSAREFIQYLQRRRSRRSTAQTRATPGDTAEARQRPEESHG